MRFMFSVNSGQQLISANRPFAGQGHVTRSIIQSNRWSPEMKRPWWDFIVV